jgi:hypothetical protein
MELLKETEPNREKADSLFGEIVSLQMELEAHVFDNIWYVRSMLTPEQREKLVTFFHQLFETRRPPPPPPGHAPPPHGQRP